MGLADRIRIVDRHYSIIAILLAQLLGSVVLLEGGTALVKDIPGIRTFFMTGSHSPVQIEELINEDRNQAPAVIEAKAETPLRESPPRPNGFSPLRKGEKIGDAQPDSEWIVIDSIKVKKLTGDDTWVRIANKNDAEKFFRKSKANKDELRALVDGSNDTKIRNGWAYLGDNFLAEK